MPPRHKMRRNCACEPCKDERRGGCENPSKCRRKGEITLRALPPKWNPLLDQHIVNDDAPPQPEDAQSEDRNRPIRFNKDVMTRGSLKEGFRVFSDPT
ncbi:hypothetical protein BD779DRAFT_1458581, partial [Infundibulicybe gibba]